MRRCERVSQLPRQARLTSSSISTLPVKTGSSVSVRDFHIDKKTTLGNRAARSLHHHPTHRLVPLFLITSTRHVCLYVYVRRLGGLSVTRAMNGRPIHPPPRPLNSSHLLALVGKPSSHLTIAFLLCMKAEGSTSHGRQGLTNPR